MSRKWLILFVFCLLPAFCGAQDKTGFDSLQLREFCHTVGMDIAHLPEEAYAHRDICLFYISGVLDGFRIGDSNGRYRICTPDVVTLGELALVVSKYLDRYSERLHNPPEYLVIDALHDAFPCKSNP